MTKLHNYNGRYCETEYENAFLSFLEEAGWNYLPGSSLPRTSMRDVLYIDDMEYFLNKTNPDLTADEIQQIMDTVRLAGAESVWLDGERDSVHTAVRPSYNGQFD